MSIDEKIEFINMCKKQIAMQNYDYIESNMHIIETINRVLCDMCIDVMNCQNVYDIDKTISNEQHIDDAIANICEYIESYDTQQICCETNDVDEQTFYYDTCFINHDIAQLQIAKQIIERYNEKNNTCDIYNLQLHIDNMIKQLNDTNKIAMCKLRKIIKQHNENKK